MVQYMQSRAQGVGKMVLVHLFNAPWKGGTDSYSLLL
jgi:hypothetical protein